MNEKFMGIYELDLDFILGHEFFIYIQRLKPGFRPCAHAELTLIICKCRKLNSVLSLNKWNQEKFFPLAQMEKFEVNTPE